MTHIDSGSAQWTNAPMLLNQLSYLGISNLRDGAPFDYALPTFTTLAQAGIRFSILEANVYSFDQTGQVNAARDVARAHALEAAVPGSVIAFEGTNEYTTNQYWLNGASSSGDLSWGLSDAAALELAVSADPLFVNTPIIAPSAIQLDSLPDFSSYVNGSNAHIYGNIAENLGDRIVNSIAFARASAPNEPVYITETGISTSGYGTSNWGVTDEDTQAVINVNALLTAFAAGAKMTFLYELMDEPNASNVQEQHFGLFHADGSPKLAATAIGNLTHLLADGGASAAPASLNYELSWMPWSASSMLLQEGDGTFDLVIWNGRAVLHDGTQEVPPPTSPLLLTLGQSASSIRVFDPIAGTTPLASFTNASSVDLNLSANPLVVEIKFGAAVAPPAAPRATNVSWISNNVASVVGTADPGDVVSVREAGTLLGTSTAAADGGWSVRLPASAAATHALTLTATDANGATTTDGLLLYGKTKQTLTGGSGSDVLIGASGDRLVGGGGDDRFVINAGPGKGTIVDFQAGLGGGDVLAIDHNLARDFADLMSHAKQSGNNVLLSFTKSDVITLENVSLGALHAGDFLFF
ncbi:hypothetical protein G7077_00925 [Sphingomonas piscis]|uniref:Bacterial Ig domain-containing protein n=1 Tax=Sphingomonas piscis TaxID=2714943 RepID=A0A6G7YLS0_9SPHN|nr:Ig-like domain-containing protein [Sphingomonas piscis]QIK77691.1 hypothetical protein G7077_00925 [Sphingomonas piscis]